MIRVGARQSKAKTTPECLTSAGRIWGRYGEKKECSKRRQDAQRKHREMFNNIYSSSEQLATGLKARWYGECTGLREPRVAEEALHS